MQNSEEIISEEQIASLICLKMQEHLDREQLKKLKEVASRILYGYKIERQHRELTTREDQNEIYIRLFKMEKENENCSRQTIRQYANAAENFLSIVNKSFKDITFMDVNLYFKYLELQGSQSAATRNNTRRYLRCFFNWLVENGYIQNSFGPPRWAAHNNA